MSIPQLVDDAVFLKENGRPLGALAILMLAVAGSSRRVYPKKKDGPNDCEAFTWFLAQRIRSMMVRLDDSQEAEHLGYSGIRVPFRDNSFDIAYILYKFYRCELVHDGELPDDVQFSPQDAGLQIKQGRFSVSISAGKTLALSYGWLDVLIEAVTHARCNSEEFGISHRDMVFQDGDECAFLNVLKERFSITNGRISISKSILRRLGADHVATMSDDDLVGSVRGLFETEFLNEGAVRGLASRGLMELDGRLTDSGMRLLREMANGYEMVVLS